MFETDLAVEEKPQAKLEVLEQLAYSEDEARLAQLDPCSDESLEAYAGKCYHFSVRKLMVDDFKRLIGVLTWEQGLGGLPVHKI